MTVEPVENFNMMVAEFIAKRLPITRATMAHVIVLAAAGMARAGNVADRVGGAATALVTAQCAAMRQAEADLLDGRPEDALATLRHALAQADASALTDKPAGTA